MFGLTFAWGWMNLWWVAVLMFAIPAVVARRWGVRNEQALGRAVTLPPMSMVERVGYFAVMAPHFLAYGLTLVTPISSHAVLVTLGGVVCLAAVVLRTMTMIDYAGTPAGALITRGVYRVSRNPGYFSAALGLVGLGLLGGSWLLAAAGLYFFVGYQWAVTLEERFCLQHWPNDYAEYKARVAKNFWVF